MKNYVAVLSVIATAALAMPGAAATVKERVNNFCEVEGVCSEKSGKIVMKLDVSELTGDEIKLVFKAFGDFDKKRESFRIKAGGINLGKFLNNTNDDGRLQSRNGDTGNFYDTVSKATVTLSTDELGDKIKNGKLRVVFKPISRKIGDETPVGAREEFLVAKAIFDTDTGSEGPIVSSSGGSSEIAPVPVPASLGLLLLGLGGFGAMARRKRN